MKPYAKNARKISDQELQDLETWLDELGDLGGVVHDLNSDQIIGGNQRSRVFNINDCEIELQHKKRKPDQQGTVGLGWVVWRGHRYTYRQVKWTPRQCEKANIVANKAGGAFDMNLLAAYNDPDDLLQWGFTKDELGDQGFEFEEDETPRDAEPKIDQAAQLSKAWKTKPGQLWRVGDHRLVCGDCTDLRVIESLMDGMKADLVFEDPPYNVAGNNDIYAKGVRDSYRQLKEADWDQDFDIQTIFPVLNQVLCDDVSVYICSSHLLIEHIWAWMADWADLSNYIVWCKTNPMPSLSKRQWCWSTELIAYATRGKHVFNYPNKGHALNWWKIEDNLPLSWWEIKVEQANRKHPTQKPLALLQKALKHSSTPGQVVFDGFLGSGTTMVSSQNLGRRCRAVEKDPKYVAVTLQRMRDAFPDIEIELIK